MTTAATQPPAPLRLSGRHPNRLWISRADMAEAEERGEIRLGGCLIGRESPDYECQGCGAALPWVALTTMPMTDTIRAAVYGHLVGDAVGVPYEFGHHIDTVSCAATARTTSPPAPGATTGR